MAYPVSDRWGLFVRRGFHPITRVDVWFPGEGIVYDDLPVSAGSVTIDRTNAIRTSGSIEVPDTSLFPALNDDSPIAPYGAELRIRTGTIYPEGVARLTNLSSRELEERNLAELVPVGSFPIWEADGSEASGNITTIAFHDRAKVLENQEHVIPRDYGGELAFTVLDSLLMATDIWIDGQITWTLNIDPSLNNITLPQGTTFDTGRWSFAEEIAEALGADIFFNREGNISVIPTPGITEANTSLDSDWRLNSGSDGVLVDVDRKVSRDETYNGVVVTGSADQDRSQPFAFETDDNPNSRTFYGGPFGKIVKRVDNSNLTSDAQCTVAAKAELRNSTGLQRTLDYQTFANPAADPGDILLIQTEGNPDEIHMLDSYSYDFKTASQDASTRSIQYVEE